MGTTATIKSLTTLTVIISSYISIACGVASQPVNQRQQSPASADAEVNVDPTVQTTTEHYHDEMCLHCDDTTDDTSATDDDGDQSTVEDTPTNNPPAEDPKIVMFNIAPGTGNNSWNTKETMLTVKIGQTLKIVNNDSVPHRLHTNGAPCAHGPEFLPGQTFNCVISKVFDPGNNPLYDHSAGTTAQFWVKAVTP